jgi:predicted house-cleaning NTP pyrophosphatase (Maf/HAM1 superfamily)
LEVPFEVLPSEYEEDMSLQDRMTSTELALFLSTGKGQSVVHMMEQKNRKAIVIAADTFISFNNVCL